MKLENFQTVATLIKEREYFATLLKIADCGEPKVVLGGSRQHCDHSLRPELVRAMLPEIKMIIAQQVAIVDEKLSALGVIDK